MAARMDLLPEAAAMGVVTAVDLAVAWGQED